MKDTVMGLKGWEEMVPLLTEFFLEHYSLADVAEGYGVEVGPDNPADKVIHEIRCDEQFQLYCKLKPEFDGEDWLKTIHEIYTQDD